MDSNSARCRQVCSNPPLSRSPSILDLASLCIGFYTTTGITSDRKLSSGKERVPCGPFSMLLKAKFQYWRLSASLLLTWALRPWMFRGIGLLFPPTAHLLIPVFSTSCSGMLAEIPNHLSQHGPCTMVGKAR